MIDYVDKNIRACFGKHDRHARHWGQRCQLQTKRFRPPGPKDRAAAKPDCAKSPRQRWLVTCEGALSISHAISGERAYLWPMNAIRQAAAQVARFIDSGAETISVVFCEKTVTVAANRFGRTRACYGGCAIMVDSSAAARGVGTYGLLRRYLARRRRRA